MLGAKQGAGPTRPEHAVRKCCQGTQTNNKHVNHEMFLSLCKGDNSKRHKHTLLIHVDNQPRQLHKEKKTLSLTDTLTD